MSAGIIISLISSVFLLFISMVLSAMSATSAQKGNKDDAHKYSTASAVVCGLAVFVLIIVLIIYINQAKILTTLQMKMSTMKENYLNGNSGAVSMNPNRGYYGEEN